MENIYQSGEYLRNNPTWHAEDSPWKAKQILKLFERNELKPYTVCEFGCGAGEILNQLCLQMPGDVSFAGYEISPQAFELCQIRKNERLHFYLKNLLEDENACFDVILAIDVFEHIEDYIGFLKKLHGKGSYKVFHIPLDLSVQTILRGSILKERQTVGHIHFFTKETAMETLKDAGYEIIDYFYTASSIDLPAKSFKSSLAKLPRKVMFKLNKDMAVRVLGRYSLMVLTK